MPRSANFIPRHDHSRPKSPWWISIPPKLSETGKRQKRFFPTKAEAEVEIQQLKIRKENHGTGAKLLSPADEQQAAAALALLREAGVNVQLVEIVGKFIESERARNASKPLAEVWEAYLASAKRSARHQANLRRALRRFEPLHAVAVADIIPEMIEKILEGAAPSYRNLLLRESGAIFAFAVNRGLARENPTTKIDRAKTQVNERAVYTPLEVTALLREASASAPELLSYLAIALFAGVRPDVYHGELIKLQWANVDLEESSIDLPAAITKKQRRRSIPIEPVLADWLRHSIATRGIQIGKVVPLVGSTLRIRLRSLYERAGIDRKQDATRHSYASYWLAKFGDENLLTRHMGHTGGADVLHKHYHRAVTKRAAEEFWSLTPVTVLSQG